MRGKKPLHPGTIAVHGADQPRGPGSPVVAPLVQSVIHELDADDREITYPRYGNSPNATAVQQRLAALEGAEDAVLLASGQGALACALMALLRPGDHVVASSWLYGGTRRLLAEELPSLGINVSLVDPMETRVWRRHLRRTTRAIFVETPANPTGRVLDLRPISYVTHESGIALVVDSTFASPINLRPLDFGADVVVHSATKYLNGHHDLLGGVVLGTEPYIEEVRAKMALWGQAPDPFAAWLLDRGLKTLEIRIARQNENAMAIAGWAEGRKEIRRVHYAGLHSHPDHEVAAELMSGFGGIVGLELSGGGRAADRFLSKLRLFRNAPSLGGVDSLATSPRRTSHSRLTAEERAKLGITDAFVRLSVGIEDHRDLIADLEQALR